MKHTVSKKIAKAYARFGAGISMGMATLGTALTVSATGDGTKAESSQMFSEVTGPIINLINNVFNVLIPLIAAVGAVFSISLGLKYSRAEEPQEREKAKQHLKSAIIGFGLIFVLVVVLRLATPALQTWMQNTAPATK